MSDIDKCSFLEGCSAPGVWSGKCPTHYWEWYAGQLSNMLADLTAKLAAAEERAKSLEADRVALIRHHEEYRDSMTRDFWTYGRRAETAEERAKKAEERATMSEADCRAAENTVEVERRTAKESYEEIQGVLRAVSALQRIAERERDVAYERAAEVCKREAEHWRDEAFPDPSDKKTAESMAAAATCCERAVRALATRGGSGGGDG